jgi:hypothetical protein
VSRKAKKECPSRLAWLSLGAVGGLVALAAYVLYWRGLLGVPPHSSPSLPETPNPAPAEG